VRKHAENVDYDPLPHSKIQLGKRMMHKFLSLIALYFITTTAFSAEPVYIGFDGSYGQKTDTSAKAIELGARIAIDEINAKGGVLNGRPLALVTKDNQGLTMRGRDNYIALAGQKDMVAVLGGKHSPVIIETIADAQQMKVPYISVWGSANQITDNVSNDSYMFRLSLKDEWGVAALLEQAIKVSPNNRKVCVLLPNTLWGRSGERVLRDKAPALRATLASVNWYNWGDKDFNRQLDACNTQDAGVILMIANEAKGALIINQLAARPKNERLPVVAHWGITGGSFSEMTGESLNLIDLRVIQTFSFVNNPRAKAQALAKKAMVAQDVSKVDAITSPVGVAQAYDTVYLIASAVNTAQATQGTAIRNALEKLPTYDGAIKRYAPAFTRINHDALDNRQVIFVRIKPDGSIVPIH
jgi:branched-chain amino acid transport system substrate-binding protein